jgi:endonuclease III
MSRESSSTRQARTRKIITALNKAYPNAHCELNYSNPLELLIATILSAQCTDKQVNIVTSELFKKYRNARGYLSRPQEELENDIRRLGFFRTKSKSIRACCRALLERHAGMVPNSMEALTELSGVGRKTANVVLGNAFGVNDGVVVDTHVTRLAHRLALSRQKSPQKIERDLIPLVPRDQWTQFSHWLIWHGRRRCTARKPDCPHCEIRRYCPSSDLGMKP